MWTAHLVRRHRQQRPDALAVVAGERALSWRELDARTDALASALLDRGVRRGERIVVSSPNRAEVLELYLAAGKAGVIVCPVNHTFPAPEVAHVIGNVEPIGVFAEQAVLDRLGDAFGTGWRVALGSPAYEAMASGPARLLALPRQDDVYAILHTSATTGLAKGVTVTHRSISACYTGMAAELGLGPHDVMVNPCPLFHGSMVIGLAVLAAGGTLVLEREFAPQRFLADVAAHRATRAFLVPAMVRFALRTRAFETTDLSSLTDVMFGGAPMPDEVLHEALERFPCPLRSIYGITEGGGPIATMLFEPAHLNGGADGADELRLRSAGRMLPGCHIEIHDRAGHRVPPGEIGELCVRGDGRMVGYWRNEAATAEVVRDGWLHTGDVAYADPDGFLYLVDRLGDVLIRGGQNVYPAEVERVLAAQPGVRDVAVVGAPSAEWGEVPVAFVAATEPDPQAAPLLTACVAELASYKRPVRIVFVPEIPRSTAGKVLRRVLRAQLAGGQTAPRTGLPADRPTAPPTDFPADPAPLADPAPPAGSVPPADRPATDPPGTDQPGPGQPRTSQSRTDQAARTDQAPADQPPAAPSRPTTDQPNTDRSGPDHPQSDHPQSDHPRADEPPADQPQPGRPATDQPAAGQPAAPSTDGAPTGGAAPHTNGAGGADVPPAAPAKGV
ncbi:AMP-binding protein [Streptomyces sp. 796.1]|uniref:class I adenylate-forming enzyme family protein n=1 Tax=Streptomyces sp. 796.1 TaxID=3163029 RepID=UPI0039C94A23